MKLNLTFVFLAVSQAAKVSQVSRHAQGLQNSLKTLQKLWQPGGAGPTEMGAMNLDLIESSLVAMAKEGATPELDPLVDQIFTLCENMKNNIVFNKNKSQKMINDAWDGDSGWLKCHVDHIDAFITNISIYNHSHIVCSWKEDWYWKQYKQCMTGCTELEEIKNSSCEEFEYRWDVYPPIDFCKLDPRNNFQHVEWTYEKMYGLWDWYSKRSAQWGCKQKSCECATANHSCCVGGCQDEYDIWSRYWLDCTRKQWNLERHACGEMTEGCGRYRKCWWERRENFTKVNKTVTGHEKAYLSEYRGILRIECLLYAFKDSIAGTKILSVGIEECIKKDFRAKMECDQSTKVCEDGATQCDTTVCPCANSPQPARDPCPCAECPHYLEHLLIDYPGPNNPLKVCKSTNVSDVVPATNEWIDMFYDRIPGNGENGSMPGCTDWEPCCAECCAPEDLYTAKYGDKRCLPSLSPPDAPIEPSRRSPPHGTCADSMDHIITGLEDGSYSPSILGGPDSLPKWLTDYEDGIQGLPAHLPTVHHTGYDHAGSEQCPGDSSLLLLQSSPIVGGAYSAYQCPGSQGAGQCCCTLGSDPSSWSATALLIAGAKKENVRAENYMFR